MPLSAEDYIAIQQLIARYAECIDESDLEGYVNNFAPDGVFENRRGSLIGRDAIREWVGQLMEDAGAGRRSPLRHIMGLPVIRGDGHHATARTNVTIPRLGEDGDIRVAMIGTYRDEIVKLDGTWYFQKRSIFMDMTSQSHAQSRAN